MGIREFFDKYCKWVVVGFVVLAVVTAILVGVLVLGKNSNSKKSSRHSETETTPRDDGGMTDDHGMVMTDSNGMPMKGSTGKASPGIIMGTTEMTVTTMEPTTTEPAPTTTLAPLQAFRKSGSDCINDKRYLHGGGYATLDVDLTKDAEACAKYYAEKWTADNPDSYVCKTCHSISVEPDLNTCPDFEGVAIVFKGQGYDILESGRAACDTWYGTKDSRNEKDNKYQLCDPGFRAANQQFTAMIWSASERFGLGFYDTGKYQSVVMLQYSRYGVNQGGREEFINNVGYLCERRPCPAREVSCFAGDLSKRWADYPAYN